MKNLAELPSTAATAANTRFFNINEASKECDLSPSVLRIWELRYGWPNPRRRPNGYRAYSQHLIDDLKRISKLVKSGIPIRELIVDGLPRWPMDEEQAQPRTIDRTRGLPCPPDRTAAELQKEFLAAVEHRSGGQTRALLQRATYQLRPRDEAAAALLPALMGIEELHDLKRGLDTSEGAVVAYVTDRSMQLLRRFRGSGQPTWVVPTAPPHAALACVSALVLNQRGVYARPWLEEGRPRSTRVVLAGPDGDELDGALGRVVLLACDGAVSCADLLHEDRPLPWGLDGSES